MVKPCIPDEFVARVEALTRRNASKSLIPNTFKNFIYKNITFVPHVQEITQGQEKIFLSRREMRIFELFIRNPKSIISREDIIKQ
jgi:DNA-binding response OmpR family regulator